MVRTNKAMTSHYPWCGLTKPRQETVPGVPVPRRNWLNSKCAQVRAKSASPGILWICIHKKCQLTRSTQRVTAIQALAPPTTKAEVRSYLGMINYLSRFIKDYATLATPLRELTKQNILWQWEKRRKNSFKALINNLSSEQVMAYFD